MIKVLLDFPWPIGAALDANPEPLALIREFFMFLDQTALKPASFIGLDEQQDFYRKLSKRNGTWLGDVLRFLNHVKHNNPGEARAVPVNGPDNLRHEWETALRDHIGDLADWRNPQIIISERRKHDWQRCFQDGEAAIALQDREGLVLSRVAVVIGSHSLKDAYKYRDDYRAHKYASCDTDPWDVRRLYYPTGEGAHYSQCFLPRPDHLIQFSLDQLDAELDRLRAQPWPDNWRYWYIPPEEWRADACSKPEWRHGSFPKRLTLNPKREHKRGWVDYSGERVWLWHAEEGHWDVQLPGGGHMRINDKGVSLG